MLERFTGAARAAVVGAVEEARRCGHEQVGSEHLLIALAHPESGPSAAVLADAGADVARLRLVLAARRPSSSGLTESDGEALRAIGIDLDEVTARLTGTFGPDALAPAGATGHRRPRFSKDAKKALELALRETIWLRQGARLEAADASVFDDRDLRAAAKRGWPRGITVDNIGSEQVLLGVIRCGGLASTMLLDLGIQPLDVRESVLRSLGRAA